MTKPKVIWWKKSPQSKKFKVRKPSSPGKTKTKQRTREPFQFPYNLSIGESKSVILKLQSTLAEAIRLRNKELIISSVKKITRSKTAIYWAVYRTISSQGARSPGYRDIPRPVTIEAYSLLARELWKTLKNPLSYRAKPLRRIFLEKPNNGGWRPISMPSYFDRCIQHLYLLILDVFQEETADYNSFGFRKFRSPGWASKGVTLALWQRKSSGPPKFALELDIAKCFDTIDHDYILNEVIVFKVESTSIEILPPFVVQQWLKQGYIDFKGQFDPKNMLLPTDKGVPQGGPISPTIMNMVLNGIEESIKPSIAPPPAAKKGILTPNLMSRKTRLLWFYKDQPVFCTFNCDIPAEVDAVIKSSKWWIVEPKTSITSRLLRGETKSLWKWRYTKIDEGLNLFEEFQVVSGNEYSKLFRFADDCVVLLDTLENKEAVTEKITDFLKPRGLQLNTKKTQLRILSKESFFFAGFEFRCLTRHGESHYYNFPPLRSLKNILQKVTSSLTLSSSPYINFRKLNPILLGWLNFYRCANSATVFSYLKFRVFHIVRCFLLRFLSRDKRYKKSGKVDRTMVYQYMFKHFLLRESLLTTQKWWAIPASENPSRGRYGQKPYFLVNPSRISVKTPAIILGKSAYHPDDRISLLEKEVTWKWGLRGLILKRSKGICLSCACCLVDDDSIPWNVHHRMPVEFGGTNEPSNLIPLCTHCHKKVTAAVRKRDHTAIEAFVALNLLSPRIFAKLEQEG